ncbi:GNAT family N-acetyltransferase [Phormidium tenue FACHB-886]|nr:GNAT family N-acetyltransferase [Phormidium tenue FACHB-886]
MKIRLFEKQDAQQVAQLFHDIVRAINIRDYSSSQVEAWAPDDVQFRDWAQVCSSRFTYVADDEGVIAGFGELEPSGHIDCFYCHKNYQRCGVGKQLYQPIEAKAIELSIKRFCPQVEYPVLTVSTTGHVYLTSGWFLRHNPERITFEHYTKSGFKQAANAYPTAIAESEADNQQWLQEEIIKRQSNLEDVEDNQTR